MGEGTLYFDLDGVLADFDAGAGKVLDTDNTYKWEWIHGSEAFWQKLNATPDFFGNLPPCPGALELWDAVKHLAPVILTALPKKGATDVERQKREWARTHLGPDAQVITCLTHEKPNYCNPCDILVDDRSVNADLWARRGGHFVLHVGPLTTSNALQQLGVI
ncbi:MAG: hypothetical protein P4M09_17335 [Devosia sp.]|nr:hypothetical protein [Devosia sp.]